MNPRADSRLLAHYLGELDYLREAGAGFAQRYPKVAGRLQWHGGPSTDPNIERLIESFAFLAARLRLDLDNEFPELVSSLLEQLYPHAIAPIPSLSIAQFRVDPEAGKLTGGYEIARHTPLYSTLEHDVHVRFRTCYPVTLWPVQIAAAEILPTSELDLAAVSQQGGAVLRWELRCLQEQFDTLQIPRLRVYLDGDGGTTGPLYDLLSGSVQQILFRTGEKDCTSLAPEQVLHTVGFAEDEALVPDTVNSHAAWRLLQEYFSFPRKFLFFDLDLRQVPLRGDTVEILFLLPSIRADRLRVSAANFLLGCTPVVNLFSRTAEPVRLDHRQSEYRVLPDARREASTEIHSIRKVTITDDTGNSKRIPALFSHRHDESATEQGVHWHARRRSVMRDDADGTDTYISFVDTALNPNLPACQSVSITVNCTNRGLAENIQDQTRFDVEAALPASVVCLHTPTPQVSPPMDGSGLWRLLSHLSLNHLSLLENQHSDARSLRDLLSIYSFIDEKTANRQIAGLRGLQSRKIVRHIGHDAWRGLCRGLEIVLDIDDSAYVGASLHLWGNVLQRLFAHYTAVNSFTQLTLRHQHRAEEIKTWAPIAGEQLVL